MVLVVSNLNDNGPGSFREAATRNQPRIIVFSVSGTIHLNSPLVIKGNATIAGQTAPGDGICLADQPVSLGGNNIIVRFLRFRMGDRYQSLKGKVPGSGSDDAFGGNRYKHLIVDHCSMSWSTDEVFSLYGGDSSTIQWNIISEPLNYSYHFEEGDTDWQKHGFGAIWGGAHLSAHHNLFAHCASRTPRFNGARLGAVQDFVDFCNNVIYNWGHNNVYGGEGGTYNIVNNYYKPGPSTAAQVRRRIVNPTRTGDVGFGRFYVAGNVMDGALDISRNNWLGVEMGGKASPAEKQEAVVAQPFPAGPVQLQDATDAFTAVLQHAGASWRRDTLDARIIRDVKNSAGRIIDVQGGFPHGTSYEQSRVAWPYLNRQSPPSDADADGMPDDWEQQHGLNPLNRYDAAEHQLHPHYTNIEVYINSIVSSPKISEKKP
ncbi:MAG TPA: pectate lyase [Lacibacter sp.]|nr:pectate lyase [Lacibacter sp.]HMO89209.1 pectate lyase [Lacibacter sp.]HMP87028.1 pectate lyase [Lacibacter sp.]